MNKVLIIDDDRALTDLLNDYLVQQGFDVDVENNPLHGIEAEQRANFDLVLLDVMMPEMDGFEVLKALRQSSTVPVIMLTAKGDDYDKILGLELGADDYLPKPFNQRELVARIKAQIRRTSGYNLSTSSQKFELHGIIVDEASQSVVIGEQKLDFTVTEYLMLQHLIKHVGKLQSKEVLSEAVLGKKLSPFDRSLDMHVSNVRKKLAAAGLNDVIKTIRGNGYLMLQALSE